MTPQDLEQDFTFEMPRATVCGLSLPFLGGADQASGGSDRDEPAYPDERDGVFETHR